MGDADVIRSKSYEIPVLLMQVVCHPRELVLSGGHQSRSEKGYVIAAGLNGHLGDKGLLDHWGETDLAQYKLQKLEICAIHGPGISFNFLSLRK